MPELAGLSIVDNATQKNVIGQKNWATLKKSLAHVIVAATTVPANDEEEWKQGTWSGDAGEPVEGKLNCRKLSISLQRDPIGNNIERSRRGEHRFA